MKFFIGCEDEVLRFPLFSKVQATETDASFSLWQLSVGCWE